MSEDVVEFGGSTELRERRPSRIPARVPRFDIPVGLIVACAAGVAAIASFLGRWQAAALKPSRTQQQISPSNSDIFYDAGSTTYGFVYMLVLLVVAIFMVLTLRGHNIVRDTARLAGLTSAGFLVAVIAMRAYTFTQNPYSLMGYPYSRDDLPLFTTKMEWGIYAAFFAGFLSIAAFLLAPRADAIVEEELFTAAPAEVIEYDDADELSVTIEPAPAVSPSHELYMRK